MRRLVVILPGLTALLVAADDLYTVATCSSNGPGSGWSINNAGTSTNACPRPGLTASAPNTDTGPLGAFQLLQAREQGRWHTFASVRTMRSGSFATHYRFHGVRVR